MSKLKAIIYLLLLVLLAIPVTSCVDEIKLPKKPVEKTDVFKPSSPLMSLSLPYNAKRPAVIMRMDRVIKGKNEEVINKILHLCAQNNITIDLGLDVSVTDETAYQIDMLRPYASAGIIGFSINYPDFISSGTVTTAVTAEKLRLDLSKKVEKIKSYYGISPIAFTTNSAISEQSYAAIRDAGFKIVSTFMDKESNPSRRLVNYQGKEDVRGMFRFPALADAAYWNRDKRKIGTIYSKDARADLLKAIDTSSNSVGVSVLLLEPESFVDVNNKIDDKKLEDLNSLFKSILKVGEITTFESWYGYAAKWILAAPYVRQKATPAFNGGKAIIFRLDDITMGWNEEVVEEIIKIFIRNGVPLDVGVIAAASNVDTFEVPMVRKYFTEGAVDISAHGYDWTFGQFNTSVSGLTFTELKFNMMKVMEQYRMYYGASPVAFTVPTDIYNCEGYLAVQESGFKIFATHKSEDNHPSLESVDCNGSRTEKGMIRIPTASDVCAWDEANRNWGYVYPILKTPDIKPIYSEGFATQEEGDYNDLTASVYLQLARYGVTAIGLHPDAFIDSYKKIDRAKLDQINDVINWAKQTATVTTFRSWYEYASARKVVYPTVEEQAPEVSED